MSGELHFLSRISLPNSGRPDRLIINLWSDIFIYKYIDRILRRWYLFRPVSNSNTVALCRYRCSIAILTSNPISTIPMILTMATLMMGCKWILNVCVWLVVNLLLAIEKAEQKKSLISNKTFRIFKSWQVKYPSTAY